MLSWDEQLNPLMMTRLQQCWDGDGNLGPQALFRHPQLDGLAPAGGEVLLRRLDEVADEELGVGPQVGLPALSHDGHQLHHRGLEGEHDNINLSLFPKKG